MFQPQPADVRRFFCAVWRKHREGLPLEPLETIALDWIREHPEYHTDLDDLDRALAAQYPADGGRGNPFLHLSLHLAISEQLQVDQPPGIRAAYRRLADRLGSSHEAVHEVMECLGEMLWRSQRGQTPPDGAAYLACVQRRAADRARRRGSAGP
ncbi:MAG: DUF1841 family protein [Lautropia sp.]